MDPDKPVCAALSSRSPAHARTGDLRARNDEAGKEDLQNEQARRDGLAA